jgi:hypothetical protein
VVNAVRVGKRAEQQQKIDELLDVIARFGG